MKKYTFAIIVVVIIVFLIIASFTEMLSSLFGKKAEIIGLCAIAVILVVMLVLNNRGDE